MQIEDDFPDLDTTTASAARMYNYALGGTDDYQVDRQAVNALEDMMPGACVGARGNRRYLERVVHYLAGESTAFILEDARNVDLILSHPDATRLIDFDEPVAVLYLSFLHLIPDADDPWSLVRRTMDRTAPGSYLAISHAAADDPESRRKITDFFVARTGGHFGRIRKKSEVRTFFDGLDIVDPGLVNVGDWHADTQQARGYQFFEYGGVGRKPA